LKIAEKGVKIQELSELQTMRPAAIISAMLDLQLNGTVYKIADTSIKKFDPENMGFAAGISFVPICSRT